MVFVNEIAEIIHGYTHNHLGAPNKNVGDAFLIVWKFLKHDIVNVDDEVTVRDSSSVACLADMAAVSFILIIAAIQKSSVLAKYRSCDALNVRMPNYSVKMGFGIHAGKALRRQEYPS